MERISVFNEVKLLTPMKITAISGHTHFSTEMSDTSVSQETYATLSFFNFCYNGDDLKPAAPSCHLGCVS